MAQVPTLGIDLAKTVMCACMALIPRGTCREAAAHPAESAAICRPTAALPHGHSSFGRCPLLGTRVSRPRADGETDVPAVRQTICPEPEKCSQRCRGYLRSGRRPRMRGVPVKSVAQQDVHALHRIRERQIKTRTALINQIRGLLAEYGSVIPQRTP